VPRLLHQVLADMDSTGVQRAVLVPPGWEPNQTALAASREHPDRFRVFGHIDLAADEAADILSGWLDEPGMSGIRLVPAQLDALTEDSSEWFWENCEKRRIPLMLFAPGRLSFVGQVANRHPQATLIVDHMGCAVWSPTSARGLAAFPQLDTLLGLAEYPNVAVKLSAVPRYSGEPYPYRDVQPALRAIFEAFGPQRSFWGSDAGGPGMYGNYQECIDLFEKELAFLTEEDKDWVMGRALSALLDWET
jgi:predicted TIM-barrel fold metal-dependent hydrolase